MKRYTLLFLLISLCVFLTPQKASAEIKFKNIKDYDIYFAGDGCSIKFTDTSVSPGEKGQYNIAIKYDNDKWVVLKNFFVNKPKKGFFSFFRSDQDIEMTFPFYFQEDYYGSPAEIKIRNLSDNSVASKYIIVKSKKAKHYRINYVYERMFGKSEYNLDLIIPLDLIDKDQERINRFYRLARALGTEPVVKDVLLNENKEKELKKIIYGIQKDIDSFSEETKIPRFLLEKCLNKFSIGLGNTLLSANNFYLASADATDKDIIYKILQLALNEVSIDDNNKIYKGSIIEFLEACGHSAGLAILSNEHQGDIVVETYEGSGKYVSIAYAINWNMRMQLIKSAIGIIPTYQLIDLFL